MPGSDAIVVGRVAGVEFWFVRAGGRRLLIARDARVHRDVHTSADITLRAGGRAGSILGMRVGWRNAAPILRVVRALLNGRGRAP